VWILYGVAAYFLTGGNRPLWGTGLIVAFAILTKPNGFLFLVIPVLGYLWLRRHAISIKQTTAGALPLVIGGGAAIALMAPFVRDTQGMLWGKTGLNEIAVWVDLWSRFGQNLMRSAGWLASLLTLPITLLAVGGLVLTLRSRQARRQALYLASVMLVQWLFFAIVSKIWYPRYLMPLAPLMALLAAYAVHTVVFVRSSSKATWRPVLVAALVASLGPALYTDFWLLTDPSRARLHPDESRQYITGWPSAYGLAEVATFISELAAEHSGVYMVYNRKGNVMAYKGLRYYLPDPPPNVIFEDFDPFEGGTIEKLNDLAAIRPTFVILNLAHEKGLDDFILNPDAFPQAEQVFRVARPGGLTNWVVYRWASPNELDQ
jgi:hypothetical protein